MKAGILCMQQSIHSRGKINGSLVTKDQNDNIGEKSVVVLYNDINRPAGALKFVGLHRHQSMLLTGLCWMNS